MFSEYINRRKPSPGKNKNSRCKYEMFLNFNYLVYYVKQNGNKLTLYVIISNKYGHKLI